MDHFLLLPTNLLGSDLIVTDIHTRDERLDEVDSLSQAEVDRIFIAGDILDRGERNVEVVEKILAMQAANKQVYCVRGNHEDYFLDTVARLEELLQEILLFLETPEAEQVDLVVYITEKIYGDPHIAFHTKLNCGGWIISLYQEEVKKGLIKVDADSVVYELDSKIGMIGRYLMTLPFVIHVEGHENGICSFNIVHADLPYNDSTLLEKIKKREMLNAIDKEYAIDARREQFSKNDRTSYSILTYCGHTIFGPDFLPVRTDVNVVSIDGGALGVVVNHTQKTISLLKNVGVEVTPENLKYVNMIQDHLALHKLFEAVISRLKNCLNLLAVDKCITEVLATKTFAPKYELCLRFIINEGRMAKYNVKDSCDYYRILRQLNNDKKCDTKKRALASSHEKDSKFLKHSQADCPSEEPQIYPKIGLSKSL